MPQSLVQQQQQQQTLQQQQRISAQQVMVVRMLEWPLAQMEQNIQAEMDENPALDGERDDIPADIMAAPEGDGTGDEGDDFEASEERKEREDELDSVLDSIDSDDRLATSNYERANNHDPDADEEEYLYGNAQSFYDSLRDQMREHILTERQEMIMEYLIGSLDSDGLLRKDLAALSDEIAIREYIDVSQDEIEQCLDVLQTFDPAGIGAQSLQQCLLIQILRRMPSPMTKLMHRVVNECYNDFTKKRWSRIATQLSLSEYTVQEVIDEIRKLNPRPGAALGETMGRSTQQLTPDFIIDSDGHDVSFTLNSGEMPRLHVSQDFEGMIEAYRQNPASMTRKDKEALLYAQQKVSRARSYIDAVAQRQTTMRNTMRAIVALQRPYLLSGDEADLRPMKLDDVAQRAGIDRATVSRVCNAKYAQTPWGIIPMKSFFSAHYDTGNGDTVSTRTVKNTLRELIDNEPKGHPLSDIRLAEEMKKRGYPIARRTVSKYREQMGIPTSKLR